MVKIKNKPYMKKSEWSFLTSFLNTEQIMLEYGSGNSTVHLAPLVKELWSLEHDRGWFKQVQDMTKYLNNVKLTLVEPNEPRTIPTLRKQFEDYINWIKNVETKFDIVLIDGRGRQWCAEEILNYLSDNHIVFLHDWVEERPHYKSVLKFYDIIDQKDRMVALRKKDRK